MPYTPSSQTSAMSRPTTHRTHPAPPYCTMITSPHPLQGLAPRDSTPPMRSPTPMHPDPRRPQRRRDTTTSPAGRFCLGRPPCTSTRRPPPVKTTAHPTALVGPAPQEPPQIATRSTPSTHNHRPGQRNPTVPPTRNTPPLVPAQQRSPNHPPPPGPNPLIGRAMDRQNRTP